MDDGAPVLPADPHFDFGKLLSLLSATITPPPSPFTTHSPLAWDDTELGKDLFSLSPLSSAKEFESELKKDPSNLSCPNTYIPTSQSSFLRHCNVCCNEDGAFFANEGSGLSSNKAAQPIHSSLLVSPELCELNPSPTCFSSPFCAEKTCDKPPSPDGGDADVSSAKLNHKARRRALNHQHRNEKRQREREKTFSHYEPRPNKEKDSVPPIQTGLATEQCSAAATAFVGLNDSSGSKKVFQLHDLVGENSKKKFGYVPWSGRVRRAVIDARGRKVAFLAGQPDEQEWPKLMQEAAEALESTRPRLVIPPGERVHRRGAFPAVPCGVSHGGGSTSPGNLKLSEENGAVMEELCKMECFRRLAGFATCMNLLFPLHQSPDAGDVSLAVMASKAPKLYDFYIEHLAKLHANHPELKRLFPFSVFAAASFNFGPQTACRKHKDFANLPFGLCAVTALGDFDPQKGGHLVLWECKLVIEFPPGATILLPSAIIAHSNTPIQKNERRYSFAQYTAGGLFRWVQHGFKLAADHYASLSPEELEAERQKDLERWHHGLSLFEQVESVL